MVIKKQGSILIFVLFIMLVLSLLTLSFGYRSSLESRTTRQQLILAQLQAQAESAAAIAISLLQQNTNAYDHRAELWHSHPPLAGPDWLPDWSATEGQESSDFVTDYQVIDEEGKLNVQYASSTDLEKLGMTPEQIASLFDWIDADDNTQSEGAEEGLYQSLPNPYHAKNGPLEFLEELLLIRGFSLRDYLGEDQNHNQRLDPEEDDGSISEPPDNADGQLQLGWVDLLTCYGAGKINLNTAAQPILETLPLSSEAVGQIVGYRHYDRQSSGSLEDHVFTAETDIDQLQGLTETDRQILKEIAVFKSEHFRIFIRSLHLPTGLSYQLQVLMRMNQAEPEILQWKADL